jgi:hypothetical protein
MSITYRGMNVSEPEITTPEEYEAFFAFGDQPTGRPLASYALWADLRPDVLKRLLNHVHFIHEEETWSCPLPYLVVYSVGGWPEGVDYIMRICQPSTFLSGPGYSKDAVIETLAVGFYLAPSWGTVIVADAVRKGLAEFQEPAPDAPSPWPEGWEVAPEALKAGLDYSTPDLTDADLRALRDWYERILGEVPSWIDFYARTRPRLLKADRNRWENIVRTGLPNQMFAYLFIYHEAWRGRLNGLREALLLGKGLGMTRDLALDAAWYGSAFLGGTATVSQISDTVDEVIAGW